ncbi:uncharacterized protein LOC130445938 isoform X2 [Diorhabda sublineata]|uniref:uncharacterized protein LOC130445938 isoform X2 n=1 Tax=Diorhabda sublineata TaxID=1163346 RepID=UPI0024E0F1D9|nr:uncharacterized protein LOC130445938 isoform X2 [Diorhabda sublineata]
MYFVFFKYVLLYDLLLFVNSEIRVKRNDIDLPTCIDKFDIHRDTIIRTQDSQNMGAKYLTELDLGSREECLHLCCETDNCDVFVFEEKNAGSCYLFQCGPPEDFKCKFTHHVNYSSAILSINRHIPDLESQIKLTKHEKDLNQLRKPELESEPPVHIPEIKPTSSSSTTIIPSLREIVPVIKSNKPPEDVLDTKCSRFQFECHSSKECIAIYNACDGIPQCADGSDEGPELGCPYSTATTATPVPIHVNNVGIKPLLQVRYDANVQQPQLPQIPQQSPYLRQPQIHHDPPALIPPAIQRTPEVMNYMQSNGNPQLQFEAPLQPYVPQLPAVQGQPNWIVHQTNQVPPQIPQYADKNSRIFNHKESGFQVPDGQEIRYNKYKGAMQYLHRALGYSSDSNTAGQPPASYPKIGNYYPESSYRQPIQQENWPSDDGVFEQQSNQENFQNRVSGPKLDLTPSLKREQTPNLIKNNVNPKHVQEQLAHDLKHSKDNMEQVKTNKVKIATKVHHEEEQYPDVISYKLSGADDLEDGVPHLQKGAVLSVSLGLIITFIMAVLIGCRLKVVRKRMRKGGKAYAHDADFLVNGMYL